jgi:hypothetical protein
VRAPSAAEFRIGLVIEVVSEDGKALKRDRVRRAGDCVVVTCEPGVFQYRLVEE